MKFVKIKNKTTHNERCYDLTVENNHNFFCNDVLVHNCDYRGEIKVILLNTGDEEFIVNKGDRIAQLVFSRVFRGIFQPTNSLSSTTRGSGGFGSTGKT
jgi:deoxyuridine 5'-triphosphate nucleotidohydrolase